jgi:hypothetical protein
MGTTDRLGTREISDRPRDSDDPRSTSAGQTQSVHCLFDQFCRIRRETNRIAFNLGIAGRTVLSMSVQHCLPGVADAFRDHRTRLAASRVGEFGGSSGLNFDREIDPVENRAADTIAIVLTAARSTSAFPLGVTKISTSARIHRGHKLKAGRIGYVG